MPEECGEQERQQLAPGSARQVRQQRVQAQPARRTRFAREPRSERRCQVAALPIPAMAGRNDLHQTKAGRTETVSTSECDHGTALKG